MNIIYIEFIHIASPYRTALHRHFSKIPVLLEVTFFAYRCMQRYIEKYTITSIVPFESNRKNDHHSDRYHYYSYRTLKNNALRAPLQFLSRVIVIIKEFYKRY